MLRPRYEIQTPEWTTIELRIAGVGSRALAALLDTAIILGVDALLVAVMAVIGARIPAQVLARGGQHLADLYAIGFLVVILFFFTVFYYVLWESLGSGQTPGKRAMKLRVVSTEGRRVTFFSALVRNLVRIVDFLPTGYLIGIIAMLISNKEQRLGDVAAGTVVISERSSYASPTKKRRPRRKVALRMRYWQAPIDPLPTAATLWASTLSEENQTLLQTFIQRAPDLEAGQAVVLAQRIVTRLILNLPADAQDCRDYADVTPAVDVVRALHQAAPK